MVKDNSAALREGLKKAKQIIRGDIVSRLVSLMDATIPDLRKRLRVEVTGMTGNTWTSPAGIVCVDGVMEEIRIDSVTNEIYPPVERKLTTGEIFEAGRKRYDGAIQDGDYLAVVKTTKHTSQVDHYALLESQQSGKGFKMTISGGTEYAGMVSLTDNYAFVQQEARKYFQ